ncbi:MAG: aminotransferase class V-fold PLP-dependent enzyme [Bryobacteraceae bacterium]|nr:aminotransferase class V-fold PLP-dependent enzyme [Bryobacteraceae bacterium]
MRRRRFLQSASLATLFGVPGAAAVGKPRPLPPGSLFERDPEAWWGRIREEQFLLPRWRAFLNCGTLGVPPVPVIRAVAESLERGASLVDEAYPRWGYETLEEYRRELAHFFGCKAEELAFTHNATEAMNIVANGLDLRPGDEVLTTDQEHPGGLCCWLLKQARYGIVVRQVAVPVPPKSPEQLVDLLIGAIGPRTRVLSFSGITTTTGLVFPVREICRAARERGVLTVVDGAQMNGQLPVNLHELGCDFFAGSPHKWLFTPPGCGLLFVREQLLDGLWVNVATGQWDNKKLKAARFMQVGTNNRAVLEGFLAGVRFVKQLGPDRVYGRIHQLARRAREQARELPHAELLTPEDDRLYAGMVAFRLPEPIWRRTLQLSRRRGLWLWGGPHCRLSTHIHTRPSDLDTFFETLREVARG